MKTALLALLLPALASADWASDQTIPTGPYDEVDILCESVRQVCDRNPGQFESHNECRTAVMFGRRAPYAAWDANGPLSTYPYYWMQYVAGPNGGVHRGRRRVHSVRVSGSVELRRMGRPST